MTVKNVDPTIFVGVYGTLRPRSALRADVGRSFLDAYSMMRIRSQALGHSVEGGTRPAHGGWAIHDAGQDWHGDEPGNRLMWIQVGLDEADPGPGRNLPIPALLACVEDVLDRAGSVEVEAVQLLVPCQWGGFDVTELASTSDWFASGSRPSNTMSARVTLDAGNTQALDGLVESLSAVLDTLDMTPSALRLDLDAPVVDPQPRLASEVWIDDGHHGVTLAVQLPEWSLDAIGWTTAALAEVLNRCTADTTVLVSWEMADPLRAHAERGTRRIPTPHD